MVLEVGARALTKHALNVHCGHDDVYAALDTGWTILFAKDAQQAADQAIILRKVNELALNPGHERPGRHAHHPLGAHVPRARRRICCANSSARRTTRSIARPRPSASCSARPAAACPPMMDLKNPILLGPVQNQEHHMNGVVARRNNFNEPILGFLEQCLRGVRAISPAATTG